MGVFILWVALSLVHCSEKGVCIQLMKQARATLPPPPKKSVHNATISNAIVGTSVSTVLRPALMHLGVTSYCRFIFLLHTHTAVCFVFSGPLACRFVSKSVSLVLLLHQLSDFRTFYLPDHFHWLTFHALLVARVLFVGKCCLSILILPIMELDYNFRVKNK